MYDKISVLLTQSLSDSLNESQHVDRVPTPVVPLDSESLHSLNESQCSEQVPTQIGHLGNRKMRVRIKEVIMEVGSNYFEIKIFVYEILDPDDRSGLLLRVSGPSTTRVTGHRRPWGRGLAPLQQGRETCHQQLKQYFSDPTHRGSDTLL